MSVTIVDVARIAGVSTATVSRVINNSGFVKDSTRRHIASIIEKYDFKPQEYQKRKPGNSGNSSKSKVHNFAMILPGGVSTSTGITAQEIMQGLTGAAGKINAAINIKFVSCVEDALEVLDKKKVDGLFLMNGLWYADSFIEKAKQFPAVWLLQSGSHDFGDRVQPDHSHVGLLAYRYLRQKGCKNLCCVTCKKFNYFFRYWRTREHSFMDAAEIDQTKCSVIRLGYDDNIDVSSEFKREFAREVVNQILAMKKRPDGIFVANTLGLPVHSELMANGIIPSKDIEMVAGDKELCGNYCHPAPVKIDIGSTEIGQMAMEAMMWRIQHPQMPQLTYMLKPSLIIPADDK